MLGELLHWIYCLPLGEAVLLTLFVSGVYVQAHRRWEKCRWWKWSTMALLGFWLYMVLMLTVQQGRKENDTVSLLPFQCYITVLQGGEKELIRSAFMNVLMFYPGGMLLRSVCKRCSVWLLVGLFLIGSVAIELYQYGFQIGTAETDDVIHNTLGAFLGMLSPRQYKARQRSTYEEKSRFL